VNQWKANGERKYLGINNDIRLQHKFPFQTPADEVANGDRDENKELHDEDDPRDVIADDNGFVNQWKANGERKFSQLGSDMRLGTLQAKRSL
jgi:hypothetical protein